LVYNISNDAYITYQVFKQRGKGYIYGLDKEMVGADDRYRSTLNTISLPATLISAPEVVALKGEIAASKTTATLFESSEKYLVIGKNPDHISFASKFENATTLNLPNKWTHLTRQEAAKFLWRQNGSQLRGAVRNGNIPFDIGYGGNFYNAEKLLLENKGLINPKGFGPWLK